VRLAPLSAQALLRQHGLRPKKSLGQNFLVDEGWLQRIVQAAGVGAQDEVLEIGAGLGSLTRHLALAAARVCAVELDGRLMGVLQQTLAEFRNVRLVQGDILEMNPGEWLQSSGYLVAANIPYYITSALMRHLLAAERKPRRLALTIQKEVAQRICAAPGQLSLLALSVQVFGDARLEFCIPAGAFYPVPGVDSALLSVQLYPQPLIAPADLETFFSLARAAFSHKRKMLHNALAGYASLGGAGAARLLQQAEIDGNRRAQTLSLAEWGRLARVFREGQAG